MATFNLNTPNIPDEADILTQVRQIRSYITNLNNQLRYDLSNIDEDNLTGGELPENAISRGFRQKVHDLQGNMSVFEQTATRILARVENAEGDISTLEQTATSFGTRISNAEGDISTLEQTANSLISRVSGVEGVNSTQQTEINQNKLDITLKASETTVTALAGRVTTAESSISTQAGQIALKAEKTVTDGLNTRLTSAEEKITPNAITATVRSHANYQSDLSAKNRTFVGGTPTGMIAGDLWIDSANGNLLKRYDGSAWAAVQDGAISIAQQQADKIQWLVASGTSAANMTLTSQLYSLMANNIDLSANNSIKLAVSGGTNLLKASDTVTTNNEHMVRTYTPTTPMVAGEIYTISMMVTPAANVAKYGVYVSSGYSSLKSLTVSGTSKQLVSGTFTASYATGRTPSDNMSHADVRIYRFPSDGTVTTNSTIHWIKLEKGTMATDWSPAPSDPASGVKTSKVTIDTNGVAITTGGVFTVSSGNFAIDASGNVTMKGQVEATSGKIGGFTISENKLIDTATNGMNLELDPANGILDVGMMRITKYGTSDGFDLFYQGNQPGACRIHSGSKSLNLASEVGGISRSISISDGIYLNGNTYIQGSAFGSHAGYYVPMLNSKNWLDYIYPVGAIYMSSASASPGTLFGGTWTAITNPPTGAGYWWKRTG